VHFVPNFVKSEDVGLHRRVLIANRGEIAIRIARAAASLGIESVGVQAPVDALSLHTRYTTDAREIRGNGSRGARADSVGAYLDGPALVRAAQDSGCDCVHPGYGFLAESAAFAELCASEGLTFVGPSPAALALFGDKVRARELARASGVPVVPGSTEPLASADRAAAMASDIGYPVLLKAAAGGGGRGMRTVESPDEMVAAYERSRSEAEGAFGDGSLFLERLLPRPRHIEVQILADSAGSVVHLHERDCSVQRRHQKVVEIAPAPSLDDGLRQRILADAVALARAGGLVNAATVEFLVLPETGEHFFIECNPRIQVEHTVTEQVTGIDLVEAQFRIAAGTPLAGIGLADQEAVGPPRGYAVQARVVATGAGRITAYKEPSGPGVRVDACGYAGYEPPPDFDPLLAKVIGASGSAGSFESAVDRTLRALGEFHVAGLPTNLQELQAILAHPDIRAGDARTPLLDEGNLGPGSAGSDGSADHAGPLALLEQQAVVPAGGPSASAAPKGIAGRPAPPGAGALTVPAGHEAVTCPMASVVVEVVAGAGEAVRAGDTLLVVSAMKMETLVTAPCSGSVTAVQLLAPGDSIAAGEVVAVIDPTGANGAGDGSSRSAGADGGWEPVLDQVRRLQALADARLAPGSDDPGVVRQRSRGKLTCRERIALLLDEGSFREVGSVAGFTSHDEDGAVVAFTPANHVGGWGRIEGRPAVVCADDFTSRGGHSDGAIGAKSLHLDRLSLELRIPSIRMLDGSSGGGSVASMVPEQRKEGESTAQESSGAITAGRPRVAGGGGSFLPGHLGSTEYTEQLSTVPVVNLLLGSVVGIGAAKAVLGHFSVMVRDIA
jgi:acetyl/propionyl-CoA carboxylase alpha subunit